MNISPIKNFFQKNTSKKILYVIGCVVVALLIFQAGIFVGYHKASFSYRSGDNFHRIFGYPERGGMMGMIERGDGFSRGEFTSGYGANGVIVKINLPTIVVTGVDNVEKVINVDETTLIRSLRTVIKPIDLKIGDTIVVMGSPDANAEVVAKFIRVLPSRKALSGASATSTIK